MQAAALRPRPCTAALTCAAGKRQQSSPLRAIAPATEEQLPGEEAALQPRPKLANSVTELIGAAPRLMLPTLARREASGIAVPAMLQAPACSAIRRCVPCLPPALEVTQGRHRIRCMGG